MTWSGPVAGSVAFGYDNYFRVTSQSVNGGTGLAFSYDHDGLMTAAGGMTINRDSGNGRVTGTTMGNVVDAYNYDGNGQLSSYIAMYTGTNPATLLYSETIVSRDPLGRITEKTDGYANNETHDWQYVYDTAGRLTDATLDGVTNHYTYDLDDNRLTKTVGYTVANPNGTSQTTGSYDAQDRMTAYGGATYAYGLNGELATKTDGTGTTSYNYDAFGNLLDVTPPTGSAIDYVIDGLNRRVGRKVGGTLVQGLLYKNQLNSVAELDGTGALVAQYVYGTKANIPDLRIDATGNVYRVLSDHLGSPRLVVRVSDGTTAERTDFDEFGLETIAPSASLAVPFGFAGGLSDSTTGLVRFGARDYDPVSGRWTSKDPIRFEGGQANIYVYVGNDPANATDTNGEDREPSPAPDPSRCASIGRWWIIGRINCCKKECAHLKPPEKCPPQPSDPDDLYHQCFRACRDQPTAP